MTSTTLLPTPQERQAYADQITARPIIGTDIPHSFCFSGDGSLLVYLDADPRIGDCRFLACINPLTLERRELLKPEPGAGDTEETLSIEEKLRRERQRQQAVGVTSFIWSGSKYLIVPLQGAVYSLNPRKEKPELQLILPKNDPPNLDARPCPGGSRLAFVRGGDLYASQFDETTKSFANPILISYPSSKNEKGVTNGLASFLAQEEMDRQHGYWWSADGRYLAYERSDERNIEEYPIIHQNSPIVEEKHRYPFAGCEKNPSTKLCVADVNSRILHGNIDACLELDITMSNGETDIYLGRVDWFSKRQLCCQILNREQSELELMLFDLTFNPPKKSILLKESTDVWINLNDIFDPLDRQNHFLWSSERSGFQHLYLYRLPQPQSNETEAVLVRQITKGDFVVEQVVGVDETSDLIYFAANAENPTERHIYVTKLFESSPMIRLTNEGGSNFARFDNDCSRFVLSSTSLSMPPRITLETISSKKFNFSENSANREEEDGSRTIKRSKSSPNLIHNNPLSLILEYPSNKFTETTHVIAQLKDFSKLPKFVVSPPSVLEFPASGGDILYSHVFIPKEEIHGKGPFPTIVVVYGGPHVQRVKDDWYSTVELRAQFYASLGYLVVKCDNRGSSRRGLEFESKIKHKMGTIEIDDQIACIETLSKLGLCDKNRVGITGWSYGGYMTALSMVKAPKIFKVGVSGAPVTSWDGYDSAYTERYMGTPSSNPQGYEDSSVMTHVSKLEGKLLLVHGMIDENVHFRHTVRLIDALINAGKTYDLLLFPNERHGPRKQQSRVYLEVQMMNYFFQNL